MGMVFSINPTAEKSQEKFKQMAIAQNGDGAEAAPPAAGTPVASPPPAATPPAATPPAATPPAAGGELATPGQGVVGNDGSCHCVVSCSASGFASSGQGIGSIGGLAGSLPMGNAMSSGGAL